MHHHNLVDGATFGKDKQRVLTWSMDGTARLWSLEANYDFPIEHSWLLVQILTGTMIDDFGTLRGLDSYAWNERKKQYVDLAQSHAQNVGIRKLIYTNLRRSYGLLNTNLKMWRYAEVAARSLRRLTTAVSQGSPTALGSGLICMGTL
ncbi:MAG: hypothetical protein C5B60_05120 [Chloroflexi bacterium]|nr:MAG: hypothetical protein C5B60_05120 [Chloroflexota bacterium]